MLPSIALSAPGTKGVADSDSSIWFQKFCITEFFVRLTEHFWERSYEIGLRIIRWGLLATLLGAVVSVFAECSPSHR